MRVWSCFGVWPRSCTSRCARPIRGWRGRAWPHLGVFKHVFWPCVVAQPVHFGVLMVLSMAWHGHAWQTRPVRIIFQDLCSLFNYKVYKYIPVSSFLCTREWDQNTEIPLGFDKQNTKEIKWIRVERIIIIRLLISDTFSRGFFFPLRVFPNKFLVSFSRSLFFDCSLFLVVRVRDHLWRRLILTSGIRALGYERNDERLNLADKDSVFRIGFSLSKGIFED